MSEPRPKKAKTELSPSQAQQYTPPSIRSKRPFLGSGHHGVNMALAANVTFSAASSSSPAAVPAVVPHAAVTRSVSTGVEFPPIMRDAPYRDMYINFVKNGLPKLAEGKQRKIIVVGAGMAGLCCSYELLRAGYDVELLERTQRACGRVYTLREPFSDGLWGEAGAMRIPASHWLDWAYITHLGIPTNRFQNASPNSVFFFEEPGIPQTRTVTSNATAMTKLETYWREKYGINEASLPISRKFDETMSKVAAEINETSYAEVVKKYDNLAFGDFLRLFGWTDQEILLFGITSTEESYMGTGAVENFAEFESRVWDDTATGTNPLTNETITGLHEVTGGMDRFGQAFINAPTDRSDGKTVAHVLRYGAHVVKVLTKPDSRGMVGVEYVDISGTTHRVDGHFIVLAVPSLVVRNMTIEPVFSTAKQRAIREIQYAPSGKIFLQYRKRWWRDPSFQVDGVAVRAPTDGGGGAFTTLPIRQIYFPPEAHSTFQGNTTERGVVIVSYTWEQDTLVWASMSGQEIVAEAAKQVDKIFPGSLELVETGAAVMWQDVEWTGGGAFAYFRPGQWTRLYKDIIAEDGVEGDPRVLFAGEQCSEIHSWIQGALDSALWACHRLIQLDCARTAT